MISVNNSILGKNLIKLEKTMKKHALMLISFLVVFCLLSCEQGAVHEHVWVEEEVSRAATCEEDGEAIMKCSCGETKTVKIDKLGHDIVEVVTDPTYLQKGKIEYKCSNCGVTDLMKPVERLDLAGNWYFHSETFINNYGNEYIYFCMIYFNENNKVQTCNYSTSTSYFTDLYSIYLDEYDYVIREKEDSEGNTIYYFNLGYYEMESKEEDDVVKIAWPSAIGEDPKYDELKKVDIRSGEILILY